MKFILLILTFVSFWNLVLSEGEDPFVVTLKEDHLDSSDIGHSVQELKEGGFVVVGKAEVGDYVLLAKFNSDGSRNISLAYGGDIEDIGYSVLETSDETGGIIVLGTSSSFGGSLTLTPKEVLLSRFSRDLSHEWTKTYKVGNEDDDDMNCEGFSFQETSDNGYIITGNCQDKTTPRYSDAILSKFDNSMTHQWTTRFDFDSDDDFGKSVQETKDGSFIVTGYTQDDTSSKLFLSKFTSNGSHIWSTTLSGDDKYSGSSVQETSDGCFILVGKAETADEENNFAMISKFNPDGSFNWTQLMGRELNNPNEFAKSVIESRSGGEYIFTGTSNTGFLITQITSSGDEIDWVMLFDTEPGGGEGYSIINSEHDAGIIVAGKLDEGVMLGRFSAPFVEDFEHIPSGVGELLFDGYVLSEEEDIVVDSSPAISVYENEDVYVREDVSPYITYGQNWILDYLFFTCDGIYSEDTNLVCSNSSGVCESYDVCDCHDGYYGSRCEVSECFGILSNDSQSSVCSNGRGRCLGYDHCECYEGFYGDECEIFPCFGVLSNESGKVCSGRGVCFDTDACDCTNDRVYAGENCQLCVCEKYWSNDTKNVCSGRGECVDVDTCFCDQNYYGSQCEVTKCFGVFSNVSLSSSQDICSGHGGCRYFDNCSCDEDYYGTFCNLTMCYGVLSDNPEVCSGHGDCMAPDECDCYGNYTWSSTCGVWTCGGIRYDNENVCNGHGECISDDNCDCTTGYIDSSGYCDSWTCQYIPNLETERVCNGHGECIRFEKCNCEELWLGKYCQTNFTVIMGSVIAGLVSSFCIILVIVFFFSFCLGVCCCWFICTFLLCFMVLVGQREKLKKFGRLRDFDLLLKEQLLDEDTSIAHLRINKSLYRIKYEELKVIKQLGRGGSNSIVYLAKWSPHDSVSTSSKYGKVSVAFKCFKTRFVCTSQDEYDGFEKEVAIQASLSHPNIIRFFGAVLEPPRVGIVMEYCSNGDLDEFLESFGKIHSAYPMSEKLRCLYEVSIAMSYLHSRNIIHRDLKMENVLVDEKEKCKLMDFGLSKFVDNMTQSAGMTKNIGTSLYMAPELSRETGLGYTNKVDIFSFSILSYIVLTENRHPYGKKQFRVETKVATDQNFRPDIEMLKKVLVEYSSSSDDDDDDWDWLVVEIVEKGWSDDPEERNSFSHISRLLELNHMEGFFREVEEEQTTTKTETKKGGGVVDDDDESVRLINDE